MRLLDSFENPKYGWNQNPSLHGAEDRVAESGSCIVKGKTPHLVLAGFARER